MRYIVLQLNYVEIYILKNNYIVLYQIIVFELKSLIFDVNSNIYSCCCFVNFDKQFIMQSTYIL